MLYLSMAAAKNTLQAQSVNSHNLANVSTNGFRADLFRFVSMPSSGAEFDSRIYALPETPGVSFESGSLQQTGNALDIAIEGEGFMAILSADGSEAYTRAGNLRVTRAGLLETGNGYPVMGNGGPILIPPAENIEIGSDGTITIRPIGQDEKTLATVNRIKLVNPDVTQLQKTGDGHTLRSHTLSGWQRSVYPCR